MGSQTVGFHTAVSVYTAAQKTILVGGTLSNNTNSQIKATVTVDQNNNEHIAVIHDAPIPEGSSLVISDAGKMVVGVGSTVSVSTSADSSSDVVFSFLKGVS